MPVKKDFSGRNQNCKFKLQQQYSEKDRYGVYYQRSTKNKIIENYTTTEDILPGGSFVYAFINPARIDRNISITVEASIANDADTSNNRITMAITKMQIVIMILDLYKYK